MYEVTVVIGQIAGGFLSSGDIRDIVSKLTKSDEFVEAVKQLSKTDTGMLTKREVEAINEALEKAGLAEYAIKGGSNTGKIDYKKVFFEQNPELEGNVVVHHSIEQQVLKRYPGLFTAEEINPKCLIQLQFTSSYIDTRNK